MTVDLALLGTLAIIASREIPWRLKQQSSRNTVDFIPDVASGIRVADHQFDVDRTKSEVKVTRTNVVRLARKNNIFRVITPGGGHCSASR